MISVNMSTDVKEKWSPPDDELEDETHSAAEKY